jgi:RNA polymerase subunit RPABC4/transcription elongation factor Spt4
MNIKKYLILCPYCMTPITEDTVLCLACQRDTTNDAPLEMDPVEYANTPRRACRHCGASILTLAFWCPQCRQRQSAG